MLIVRYKGGVEENIILLHKYNVLNIFSITDTFPHFHNVQFYCHYLQDMSFPKTLIFYQLSSLICVCNYNM